NFAKHRNKRTHAVVTDIERNRGDRLSCCKKTQCLDEANLLTEAPERHAGFGEKKTLDGSLARPRAFCEGLERPTITRRSLYLDRDFVRARISWLREV